MNTRLGHYDIVEELGRGGMGVVYKGYESSLGRYVAIKVLSASMAHDKVFVERFLREARAMATLNDAHIIQIYFIGQHEEQTFFVMEYIDGESLSTVLKREVRLETSDALKVLLYASQGLAAAHQQGVIHRDIKPGNIMVTTRGQVKVADFGIALANHDVSAKLTNTGAFVGTPGYLSPEVCLGKQVDQRSDIFALGIVLFEMLSGRMPFQDDSPLKLMLDVVQSDAPDIRELNAEVDDEVARMLKRMLAKDPNDRYQSCEDLNADLMKHPLVAAGGQLKLRPAPWAGANASNPTVVGAPTPLTPGAVRGSTPPPIVSAPRAPALSTPVNEHATVIASAPAPAKSGVLRGAIAAVVVLAIAGAGWTFYSRNATPSATTAIPGLPDTGSPAGAAAAGADAAAATPAAGSAGAGPATEASATAGNAPIATDATGEPVGDEAATGPLATVRYGHGGPNTSLNRVRVRPAKVLSAQELLVREQARQQNELAAQAAINAAAAPASAPTDAAANAAPTKERKTFLCKVFKKCDPPKKGSAPATPTATEAAAPAVPVTP